VQQVGDYSGELPFTAEQIEEDNKNYHAWAYRQWVIQQLNGWDQELQFIDTLLQVCCGTYHTQIPNTLSCVLPYILSLRGMIDTHIAFFVGRFPQQLCLEPTLLCYY
jgi:hypothetical protein